ncbi:MAG: hypothetical protein MJZ37_03195 [Bacilli bacterium]|nr:hypothetical protein [Bacilli bacterium]
MDGVKVYEETLLNNGLRKMKNLRDGMNETISGFNNNIVCDYSVIAGVNDDSYLFVMKQVEELNVEVIENTIIKLLNLYEIKYKNLLIPWKNIRISSKSKEPIFLDRENEKNVFLLVCSDTLFIFKKYGMQNYLNQELLKEIKNRSGIKNHKYIALIEGNAYSDILNHNDDVNDESRGTNCFSLKYFFDLVFGKGEYPLFKSYFNKYSDLVKEYFGIAVVKTLHPNTLFSYKDDLRKKLKEFDYRKYESRFSEHHISDDQLKLLHQQFIDEKYYELLIGNSEFARCFLTSDWLYSSFGNLAGSIDLTAISMGYYKALEQFMFEMISMYTIDKGYQDRKITFPKRLVPLTDDLIRDDKKSFTFGPMAKFLTSSFNKDIIRDGIEEETVLFGYDVINNIKEQRNGFFHKDNITDWEKIENDRVLAFTSFFILLSLFKFPPACNLSPSNYSRDDFELICEHFDNLARNFDPLELPIIYINTEDSYNFYLVDPDPSRNFAEDGQIEYSGLYIHSLSDNGIKKMRINSDEMKKLTIRQGRLKISKDLPITIRPTGPENMIVDHGRFVFSKK